MTQARFFPLAALHANLRGLLVIRCIVLACQCAALAYARVALGLALPYGALLACLGLAVALNLGLALRLRHPLPVHEAEFFIHLLLDCGLLFLLLYFSGGANNPFVSYFLLPVTIAAALLPRAFTWAVAGSALLAYTLLLFFHQPLPLLTPENAHHGATQPASPHVLGMWFNFLVSAALISWFVARMAAELRAREQRLARHREDDLRNEQILAVATQAAGTAHELGTPLSTAAVLLKDLEREYAEQPALQADLGLLRAQVERCRAALKEVVSRADIRRRGSVETLPLLDFVRRLLDQWLLLRPEVSPRLLLRTPGESPCLSADSTLQQAIVNMLDNAADASPERLELALSWSGAAWRLEIRDFGPGIDPEVARRLGTGFVSTKDEGLGVGLLISQATINRLGGEVSLHPHPQRGTVTSIVLPLPKERAGSGQGQGEEVCAQ